MRRLRDNGSVHWRTVERVFGCICQSTIRHLESMAYQHFDRLGSSLEIVETRVALRSMANADSRS